MALMLIYLKTFLSLNNILLLGASSPAGNEFSVLARNCEFVHLVTGTRSFSSDLYTPFFVDLENPLGFRWPDHFSSDIYIVSFAPWLLFFKLLMHQTLNCLLT